ncbi:hypothetical protein BH24BAC1_BH24BAC1_03940 [soil metagenome]
MNSMYIIVAVTAVIALGLGVVIGQVLLRRVLSEKEEEARDRASRIIKEAEQQAETIKKDRILEAKEKYLKLKAEFEDDVNKKKNIILQNENKVKQREQAATKQLEQAKRK